MTQKQADQKHDTTQSRNGVWIYRIWGESWMRKPCVGLEVELEIMSMRFVWRNKSHDNQTTRTPETTSPTALVEERTSILFPSKYIFVAFGLRRSRYSYVRAIWSISTYANYLKTTTHKKIVYNSRDGFYSSILYCYRPRTEARIVGAASRFFLW